MRIVRKGGLDEVNETNNKKTDFIADVYFWSPFGKEYDFVLRDCYIRIQGTSSTKYPSKNIRIYFTKGGANQASRPSTPLVLKPARPVFRRCISRLPPLMATCWKIC